MKETGTCTRCKRVGVLDTDHSADVCVGCVKMDRLFPRTPEPATEHEITRRALELAVSDLSVYPWGRKIETGSVDDYLKLAEQELEKE
jgi:hypothetical protein